MHQEGRESIVILGAGFAGVACVRELVRHRAITDRYQIVLVDRHTYHLFTPWLYERATTGAPTDGLKIPLRTIFGDLPVDLLHDEVISIDRHKHQVMLRNGQRLRYTYLVLALGSVPNFFDVPGLAKHALTLKSYADSERIHEATASKFSEFLTTSKDGDLFQVIIGGGGLTGVELAAELHHRLKQLAQGLGDGEGRFVIKVLDAEDRLVQGLPTWMSQSIQTRLGRYRRIEVMLQSRIIRITATRALLANGDSYEHELFIWTGGVMANPLASVCELGSHDRVKITTTLQLPDDPQVFAIGDNAVCRIPRSHKESRETIVNAYRQGHVAATNLLALIESRPLRQFVLDQAGYVVPVARPWAVSSIFIPLKGRLAYWLLQLIHLRYFLMILPVREAVRRWWR